VTLGSSLSAQRLVERGASELQRAGVDQARFEAEMLLRHALGCSRESFLIRLHDPVSAEVAGHFFQLVDRRRGRVPIQHILGTQEFYGLTFRVTPAVLIPRPETEGLVEEALRELAETERPRIADVGCGSGCIAVAIAHESPAADLVAIDASPGALAVARENASEHGVAGRIDFVLGDLLAPLLERGTRVHAVVTNPPYVDDEDLSSLAPEVSEHEPRVALSGGPGGLAVIARLVTETTGVLEPGGVLVMEIGLGQSERVTALAGEAGLTVERIVPDLAGIPRVVVARRA
jgi:release factor glutamine methyltransferase